MTMLQLSEGWGEQEDVKKKLVPFAIRKISQLVINDQVAQLVHVRIFQFNRPL